MSPTEFDLRAALRDGEGDDGGGAPLDVDAIVDAARAHRNQRRTRILSAAAAVVVVAAAGVGGALLIHRDSGGSGGQAGASSLPHTAPSANSRSGNLPSHAAGPSSSLHLGCPTAFPQQMMPGGGSPGQFGSDGPMFAQPVASVRVCAYGSGAAPVVQPAQLDLTGTQATALADSLENASRARSYKSCPVARNPGENRLAIYATTPGNTQLPVVTATLTRPVCDVVATNGTAVRYDWRPPGPFGCASPQLRSPGSCPRDDQNHAGW